MGLFEDRLPHPFSFTVLCLASYTYAKRNMTPPEESNNAPFSEVGNLTEKSSDRPTNSVTTESTFRTSENNGFEKVNAEGGSEIGAAREEEDSYPHGITFVLLTIGLMAVVLVLALDNYIICPS